MREDAHTVVKRISYQYIRTNSCHVKSWIETRMHQKLKLDLVCSAKQKYVALRMNLFGFTTF